MLLIQNGLAKTIFTFERRASRPDTLSKRATGTSMYPTDVSRDYGSFILQLQLRFSGTFGTTEGVRSGHDFTRVAIDERFECCGGWQRAGRADSCARGNEFLPARLRLCAAQTGILNLGKPPTRDHERNYL
jgi:hypothetical protein